MSAPKGYVPLVEKGQSKDDFVKEELSKHGMTFEDLVADAELYAIVSATENFKEMMAKESEAQSDSDGKKTDKSKDEAQPDAEMAKESQSTDTGKDDALKIETPEFEVDDDPIVEVEKKEPAKAISKAADFKFRTRTYDLNRDISINMSTGLLHVTDFGVGDLIEPTPFSSKRSVSRRQLEFDRGTHEYITPGFCTAPTSDANGYVTGHCVNTTQFPSLRPTLGMEMIVPGVVPNVAAPDVNVPGRVFRPVTVSLRRQGTGTAHTLLIPKGRLEYIKRAVDGYDFLMLVGSGQAAFTAFIAAYMDVVWSRALRFRLPKIETVTYDEVQEVRYPKMTFGNVPAAFFALEHIAQQPVYGEDVRERSMSTAMGVFSDVGDSSRVISTAYKGTTPSFTTAVSQLTAPVGREFITKLASWGMGGYLRDIDVEFDGGVASDPQNELRGICAAATLLMLPYDQLSNATLRTLIHHVLQDFYHSDSMRHALNPAVFDPAAGRFPRLPTIRLPVDPNVPAATRVALQGWLNAAMRRDRTLPLLGPGARIWQMGPRNTPSLIAAVPPGSRPIDLHLGTARVEDVSYDPVARALQNQMIAYTGMLGRMKLFGKPMIAHFRHALSTSDYLSSSISTIMSRAIRGWENLDLLPPQPGGGGAPPVLPVGSDVMMPYEGAFSFITFGISHDTQPIQPWMERKEIKLPSSYPFLLEMEGRVAYEVSTWIADPARLAAGEKVTAATYRIYREEVLDFAEHILKKYIASPPSSSRQHFEYYLFDRVGAPFLPPAILAGGAPFGIPLQLKATPAMRGLLGRFEYRNNIFEETMLYIKLDGPVNTVPIANADLEHSDYELYHEYPAANEVVPLRNVIDEKVFGLIDDEQFGIVDSSRKLSIELIKRMALGMRGRPAAPPALGMRVPANTKYVSVKCRTKVKLIELMDEVSSIVDAPDITMTYEDGTSNIKFEVSEIPVYYRWDRRPGYNLVAFTLDFFPGSEHLSKIVLESDPRKGYTEAEYRGGAIARTTMPIGDHTELVSVMRRDKESIDNGLELLVDTL